MRLDARDDTDREVGLACERAQGDGHGPGGDAGQIAEERSAIEAPRAQALRDGEHHLAVRHVREQRVFEPERRERPEREALGVAARAEVARPARKGEQVFVRTRVTADARKAVFKDAAREELVGHLRYDGAPRAVCGGEALVIHGRQRAELILHEP